MCAGAIIGGGLRAGAGGRQVPQLARFCFPGGREGGDDARAAAALRSSGLPAAFASTRYITPSVICVMHGVP